MYKFLWHFWSFVPNCALPLSGTLLLPVCWAMLPISLSNEKSSLIRKLSISMWLWSFLMKEICSYKNDIELIFCSSKKSYLWGMVGLSGGKNLKSPTFSPSSDINEFRFLWFVIELMSWSASFDNFSSFSIISSIFSDILTAESMCPSYISSSYYSRIMF